MKVSDIFRSVLPGGAKPETSGTPVTPGNIPPADASTGAIKTDGNGDVPGNIGVTEKKNESPLDKFTEVVNTKPNDSAIPNVTFDAKPEDLLKIAQTKDYTKSVTQEQVAAITEGGEKAAKALISIVNSVAQSSFADSAAVTGTIVEQALAKQNEHFQKALPGILRNAGINKSVADANPIFKHPAVKTMVSGLASQLATKYPDASEAEITEMAQEYFTTFAGQLNSGATKDQPAAKSNEMDWSEFAS